MTDSCQGRKSRLWNNWNHKLSLKTSIPESMLTLIYCFWRSHFEVSTSVKLHVHTQGLLLLFRPGKRRIWGDLVVVFRYIKTRHRLFTRACSDRTRGKNFKLKECRFRLAIAKKVLQRGWWDTGAGCREKLWLPPPWQCSRPGWMEALSNLAQW